MNAFLPWCRKLQEGTSLSHSGRKLMTLFTHPALTVDPRKQHFRDQKSSPEQGVGADKAPLSSALDYSRRTTDLEGC